MTAGTNFPGSLGTAGVTDRRALVHRELASQIVAGLMKLRLLHE